ncbi:hypothetical protein INR49_014162, partial [Caranx melampygus]
ESSLVLRTPVSGLLGPCSPPELSEGLRSRSRTDTGLNDRRDLIIEEFLGHLMMSRRNQRENLHWLQGILIRGALGVTHLLCYHRASDDGSRCGLFGFTKFWTPPGVFFMRLWINESNKPSSEDRRHRRLLRFVASAAN